MTTNDAPWRVTIETDGCILVFRRLNLDDVRMVWLPLAMVTIDSMSRSGTMGWTLWLVCFIFYQSS